MEPANAHIPFARKKLKDGTVLPLSERERIAVEKAIKLQERTQARNNMDWMRHWEGAQWSDEEHEMLVAMLGLEDIDV
jgi:hypothetical protein